MPIYEYQCTACSHPLEVIQKFADAPLTECPACHQPSLQKLISAAGFQLKGSGWYATDYKAKPSNDAATAAAPANAPADKATTTETKPSNNDQAAG